MNPVILFGLDGATFTVLDDLVRRGVMPYLGRFLQQGTRGVLMSNLLPLTPPAWSTLVTGRSPGHHGVVGFFQPESPSSGNLRVASSRDLRSETIWSMVNRHGLRAGSLNFVLHSPPPRIDGYVIPGWVPWKWLKRFSHPAGLIEQLTGELAAFDLKALAMDFEEERKCLMGEELEDPEKWIGLHIARDRQWFRVLRRQMEHDPCPLAGIVFDGVDKLQHLLWPHLDPALQPQTPDAEYLRIRDMCWEYFRQLDGFLRETVEAVGPDGTVMIVSDHGFSGSHETLFINSWLERHGYLVWGDDAPEPGFAFGERYWLRGFDLQKTTAFALTGSSNGIYFQVRGQRGKYGIAPGEYQSFRRELQDRLLNDCKDPVTGDPIVTHAWTREEAFAGPHGDVAPDLTLELRDHGFVTIRRSKDGVVQKRSQLVGTHHPEGVFAAYGAGVRRGARIAPVRLLDIAPTALHRLGLPVPVDLEGRAIEEMFTPAWKRANPVRKHGLTQMPGRGAAKAVAASAGAESPEQHADLLEKLKLLGYME
jgi:predicted AlkP superfamily phosphohydrolase/phosphomutase